MAPGGAAPSIPSINLLEFSAPTPHVYTTLNYSLELLAWNRAPAASASVLARALGSASLLAAAAGSSGGFEAGVRVLAAEARALAPHDAAGNASNASSNASDAPARPPPSTRRYPFVWRKGLLNGYSSTRRLAMGLANVRASRYGIR